MFTVEGAHQLLVGHRGVDTWLLTAMAGPLRTVIGHGGILAHLNLPVETLFFTAGCLSLFTTGTAGGSLNAGRRNFKIL
jgi:hypothetical protein